MKKFLLAVGVAAVIIGLGVYCYQNYKHSQAMLHPRFYSGNGRLEATEVYIAAKRAERIKQVFVDEGTQVKIGDKLALMDTSSLENEKAATIAKIKVQEGELAMAKAGVLQCESTFNGAKKEYDRNSKLRAQNAVSQKDYENAETNYNRAKADLEYAKASVIAAEGRVAQQQAELKRIEYDIETSLLVAPYDGRIQYLLARNGEVVSAGGRVMNLVNLTDVYMTFFLPTSIAGQVQMGAEVRLVFDAAPDEPVPATVTFIDPVAQFTPKSVETAIEREKLMFRIKAHVDAELLRKYISNVKTGLPGVAWVKLDPNASWKEAGNPVLHGTDGAK